MWILFGFFYTIFFLNNWNFKINFVRDIHIHTRTPPHKMKWSYDISQRSPHLKHLIVILVENQTHNNSQSQFHCHFFFYQFDPSQIKKSAQIFTYFSCMYKIDHTKSTERMNYSHRIPVPIIQTVYSFFMTETLKKKNWDDICIWYVYLSLKDWKFTCFNSFSQN